MIFSSPSSAPGAAMMEGKRGHEAQAAEENTEGHLLETMETIPEGSRRRIGSHKRKAVSSLSAMASVPSSSSFKRLIKEPNAINVISSGNNGPCTRARQFPGKITAASPQTQEDAAMAESVVEETGKELVFLEDPVKSLEVVDPSDALNGVDGEFEAVRSRGAGVHVVPTSAGWFSWEKIHELEKHALPSFFNGQSESKTPETYLDIRNSIMHKFHSDPQTPIEAKDLSDISIGELVFKQEVFEFLDHWGLVNFHPLPCSIADTPIPEFKAQKTVSLLDQLYRFENEESSLSYLSKKREASPPILPPNLIPESAFLDDMVRPFDPSVEYHCNSCSADCSRRRYHCQKQADFDLCAECYNIGAFDSGMMPTDFILMESAEGTGVSSRSWTDQETLLLLEASELFGENFNEIAEHVATKTKAQCILHFLQMPISDPFLEEDDNSNKNVAEESSKEAIAGDANETRDLKSETGAVDLSTDTEFDFAINCLKSAFQVLDFPFEDGKPISFAEVGNPVMLLAAFLERLVEQDAVSTLSRCSLKVLMEESPGTQLASRHCFILEDPPNNGPRSPLSDAAVGDIVAIKMEDLLQSRNSSPEQREIKPSNSNEILQKSSSQNDLTVAIPMVDAASCGNELSDDKPLPEEQSDDKKDAIIKPRDDIIAFEEGKVDSLEQLESIDLILEQKNNTNLEESIVLKEDEAFDANEAEGIDDKMISSPIKDTMHISPPCEGPHIVNGIRRAAVSVLSAAAVKARLLVDEEEDQIRQIASFVIEKQLRKIEAKLWFFPEMENLVAKAKEQTEKARQKLINERAQIIAARLGLSQSSSRAYTAALTGSKLAAAYGAGIRPSPLGMAHQRPPPPRRP